MKPPPTHVLSFSDLCALYMTQASTQSDVVAAESAINSSLSQPWLQMVVYCHSRNLVRALKELYEVVDVQPVVGWAIVRSKVSLESVDVALGVIEEVVGNVDVDATVGHV
jgi:hypothetical protein